MPDSQVSLDAGGSRWTLSVSQAPRKLPLKFVPSQTWGDFVDLQIWMTGLLLVLVVMQVSKTLHGVQMKSVQLAVRLTGQCSRSMEVMDGKEVLAHQEDRLWTRVMAGAREALEYGNGTLTIDRGENLWLGSKWGQLKAGSEAEQGVYVPAGDVRRE